jgi:hypothetical protein
LLFFIKKKSFFPQNLFFPKKFFSTIFLNFFCTHINICQPKQQPKDLSYISRTNINHTTHKSECTKELHKHQNRCRSIISCSNINFYNKSNSYTFLELTSLNHIYYTRSGIKAKPTALQTISTTQDLASR